MVTMVRCHEAWVVGIMVWIYSQIYVQFVAFFYLFIFLNKLFLL